MSLVERCGHQGIVDNGHHALFNEKWERCKNCAYNLEENKRCPDYTKTTYEVPDKKFDSISGDNLKIVYSVANPDLNKAIA